MSLKCKLTTSRAQSAYRRTMTNQLPRLKTTIRENPVFLPEEQHPYGRPNRPGTPVGDVISNYYGDNAEKQISVKYEILKETTKPLGLGFARGHTRASAMAHNYVSQAEFTKSI